MLLIEFHSNLREGTLDIEGLQLFMGMHFTANQGSKKENITASVERKITEVAFAT